MEPPKYSDFSTTMLRAVSVFVIGAAAFALVAAASNVDAGTPLSDLIRGVYRDEDGLALRREDLRAGSFLRRFRRLVAGHL